MAYRDLGLEKDIWKKGYVFLAGIDEAGRGPWAGPVVSAAVVFNEKHSPIVGVNDSKKISEKKRDSISEEIKVQSLGYGYGIVNAEIIDDVGIAEAVQIAMITAVHNTEKKIGNHLDYLIVDGAKVRDIEGYEQRKVDRADEIYYTVASASILAKVRRDSILKEYGQQYPQYGFENHKGYGTKQHKEALTKYGPTKIHRLSYKPVRLIAQEYNFQR